MTGASAEAASLRQAADDLRGFPWARIAALSLLLVMLMAAVKVGLDMLNDPTVFPVKDVMVDGEFVYLQRQDVINVVTDEVKLGFFNLDLDKLTGALEALPWVKAAAVRRVWPEKLVVEVVEQQAFAYWGDTGLVSVDGKVFFPDMTNVPNSLPSLMGPVSGAGEMTVFYRKLTDMLIKEKLIVAKLRLDDRRAWTVTLDNGLVLKLGRTKGVERIQRFFEVYSSVAAERVEQVEYVDLRYPNGFSIQWRSDAGVVFEQ